jgi:hypothetical protein
MRATDQRREETVARLGEGYAAGALGTDTFSLRVDRAYRARSLAELRALTADLPLRRLRDRVGRIAETVAPRPAVAAPVLETVDVCPPPGGDGPWTIGRSPACALTLDHDTVSRRHAELRRTDDGWEVRDLGSLNGTRVNGWRVMSAPVREGDELRLGDLVVVLVAR